MRIIAGAFRGRALASVGKGDKAAHLRPTTDRVRESVFSVLDGGRYGAPLAGALVLDLFAGTGALGLEALSRGASRVCFVENGRPALGVLRENIALCRAQEGCDVLVRDARRLGVWKEAAFDLVFLDPPYGKGLGEIALESALAGGWVAPGALIVWEESAPAQSALPGVTLLETRRYGSATLSFLRVESAS